MKNIFFWELQKYFRIEKYIFWELQSALDITDVAIFKAQNSMIWKVKFGEFGWIEYIDKDVFTALAYLAFRPE